MPRSTGDRLGPFEIRALIGAGGMGEVYQAIDTRLGRTVAIKFSKDRFSERFEREARVVAALNHPHICQLYDLGPDYLVFEFIDGTPIKGPLSAPEAVRLGLQITEALEEAHAHGIVHRDLKPANILLTARGIKVLDFGLAKQSREDTPAGDETRTMDLTRPGAVMGTPAYMAPEQWQGKPADARSDIYAFGCVLYELLTGSKAGRERKPLQQAALEAIVRRCLAEDPAQRFQCAAELKAALTGAARYRSRLRYAVAAGVLVLLGVAGFFGRRADSKAKLTDQDILVVADFDNKTGDPVFDAALKQALAFQLQQSPFLKAMDEADIRQTLRLSGRPSDTRVTGEIARDICIRDGEKATLAGSITGLGSRYLISLQAVNCQTGETLAREQAEAAGKEQVVDALAQATNAMRARLGESLSMIQPGNRTLPRVTTSSLEALQSFNMGSAELGRTYNLLAVLPFIRRATELDPNFAMAYYFLSLLEQETGDPGWQAAADRAHTFVANVSERERLLIERQYSMAHGDGKKIREIMELAVKEYPRDAVNHNDLAFLYLNAGEPERALPEIQAAIGNGFAKAPMPYGAAGQALADLNRVAEAKAILQKGIANASDAPALHYQLLIFADAEGDGPGRQRETQWLAGHQAGAVALLEQANDAATLGHARQAAELFRKSAEESRQHPAFPIPQQFLPKPDITAAVLGSCTRSGRQESALVVTGTPSMSVAALCDSTASQQFNEQLAANGVVPVVGKEAYVRGLALLAAGRAADAASVFASLVEHKAANWGPEYAAAQVGVARAAMRMGDTGGARKAYEDFFTFWKDADPDVPLLVQARKEYAALQ